MNSLSIDVFCSKHSDCEAPISVITEILSKNDPLNFENISKEFDKLGFTKVKDLAGATLEKVSLVKLSGDSLMLLYEAIEIYSKHLDDLLKAAKSEHQNGNFINTQKICNELLTHKPTDLNVILLNAKSFFNCGNYEECIDCLEKAKNINPKCYEVLNGFALVYMKKSENDLAKQYFFEACEIKPFSVDAWTNYADFLFKTNDLNLAEQAYKQVLSLNPELYNVRNMYGNLLLKLNKIKDAKKQFKIVHNCATEYSEPLNKLGYIYYKSGKFEKAIFIYKKVLELEPENCVVLRNLAGIYCRQENIVLSVEIFKKCLKLQPENFDIHLDLALINLHNLKDYRAAVKYLKKCIKFNSKRKDLYENLLAAYRLSNDNIEASATSVSLGDLYLESNDLENAKNSFDLATILNPENGIGHFKMGLILHDQGQLDMAFIRYRKAIEAHSSFPDVYYNIGRIYEANNLFERALLYYRMSFQLQPDHLDGLINFTILKKKLG